MCFSYIKRNNFLHAWGTCKVPQRETNYTSRPHECAGSWHSTFLLIGVPCALQMLFVTFFSSLSSKLLPALSQWNQSLLNQHTHSEFTGRVHGYSHSRSPSEIKFARRQNGFSLHPLSRFLSAHSPFCNATPGPNQCSPKIPAEVRIP